MAAQIDERDLIKRVFSEDVAAAFEVSRFRPTGKDGLTIMENIPQYAYTYKHVQHSATLTVDAVNGMYVSFREPYEGLGRGEVAFGDFTMRATGVDVQVAGEGVERTYTCSTRNSTFLLESRNPAFGVASVRNMLFKQIARPLDRLFCTGRLQAHVVKRQASDVFVTPEVCKHYDLPALVLLTTRDDTASSAPATVVRFKRLRSTYLSGAIASYLAPDGTLTVVQVKYGSDSGPQSTLDDPIFRRLETGDMVVDNPENNPDYGLPGGELGYYAGTDDAGDAAAGDLAAPPFVVDERTIVRIPLGTDTARASIEIIPERIRVNCSLRSGGTRAHMYAIPSIFKHDAFRKLEAYNPVQVNVSARTILTTAVPDLEALDARAIIREAPV